MAADREAVAGFDGESVARRIARKNDNARGALDDR
jgi:hypothetical protein